MSEPEYAFSKNSIADTIKLGGDELVFFGFRTVRVDVGLDEEVEITHYFDGERWTDEPWCGPRVAITDDVEALFEDFKRKALAAGDPKERRAV